MKWENFENLFEAGWGKKLRPFVESPKMDEIYAFLKERGNDGHRIVPRSKNTFRCFLETPYKDLKCVLMGMAPYHTVREDYNKEKGQKQYTIIADGLLMGCSITEKLQPSLEKFYEGIEHELYKGLNLDYFRSPNVDYLASQGVLMFNGALTTEQGKKNAHDKEWEPFTIFVMEIIALTGVPVVFLGDDAAKYSKYLAPMQWHFEISHPASASYKETLWDTKGTFGKVNKILKDQNNEEINWLYELPF